LRPVPPSDAEHNLEIVLEASDAPVYNTAAVARRCQLPAATFQAWERRYGFPEPRRGPGRQRLYSERDVQAIRWLQARITEGLTIRAALALLRARLTQPPASPQPAASIGRPDHSTVELARRLERALLAFDRAQAGATLGEAFGLYPVEQVCLEVLQPTLHAIGLAWQAGTADVTQEHFASSYIRQRLTALLELSGGGDRTRSVVAACAPDDWHELGLLMVALFLARRGWHVVYLGASLPPDGLEARLRQLQPTAVVFSASTPQTATSLAAIVRQLTSLPPPQPLVGYGGHAFVQDPTLCDAAPGLYLGPNAATAVTRLEHALDEAEQAASVVL
jgi:methanogenic corrinoid protein MtbC1